MPTKNPIIPPIIDPSTAPPGLSTSGIRHVWPGGLSAVTAGSKSEADTAAGRAIDRAQTQGRATSRLARGESRRVQARKDRDAGSTTHTPIPVTRGPNRMDRGEIREAAHSKPVRSSRAKGTPRGIRTRSNAPGDVAESGPRPAFASCLARILSKTLTKRSPGRSNRPESPLPGEHETCSQARNSRQIKAVGIRVRVRARARFNQSQPLAT